MSQFENEFGVIVPSLKDPMEILREAGPEIAEFEAMVTSFELKHPLEELNAITNITMEESRRNPVRESARVDLFPIVFKLNILKKETNISEEKYDKIKAKYMRISRAVGIINNNKVDHER